MGPEQWLFLQWHEHKGSLISTFEKLFERNTFVDCTLAAEGQYLNVHKVILSACSPYFEILLNENRDKHPIIILKDVKFRSLKSIIEYMYRGEANVLSTEIKDFLSAAETLQIKGLGKQGGGDTKNTPPKELRDFVEAESLTTGSQEISHDSGEKEMWRNPDLASVLSETSCESANQNNTVFSQGDHLSTKKIAPQRITVPVMRVEEEKEIKWPKMEGNDEPRKCLKAVMPTLNLGSHAMEPVHHATVDKVLDLNVCNTSLQSVPSTNDAQMSMELTRKNELEPEPQQALGTRETEEVETASVASSAIEVSDTTEEWAEEDIEEGPTPSQATGHSAPADESHPLFDASNMTRDSVSRNIANDHQGRAITSRKVRSRRSRPSRSPPHSRPRTRPISFTTASTSAPSLIPVALPATTHAGTNAAAVASAAAAPAVRETVRVAQRRPSLHKQPRKLTCPECHKVFHRLDRLKRHLHKHHGDQRSEEDTAAEEALLMQMHSVLLSLQSCIKASTTSVLPKSGGAPEMRKASLETLASESLALSASASASATSASASASAGKRAPQLQPHAAKRYICPVCHKVFPWLCELKAHMPSHKNVRTYKCTKCDFMTAHPQALTEHLFSHIQHEPVRCQECDAEFPNIRYLIRHINTVHGYPFQRKLKKYTID